MVRTTGSLSAIARPRTELLWSKQPVTPRARTAALRGRDARRCDQHTPQRPLGVVREDLIAELVKIPVVQETFVILHQ